MNDGTYRRLAEAVLIAHQRRNIESCMCGWSDLGRSHAGHVAEVLMAAGALRVQPSERTCTVNVDGPGGPLDCTLTHGHDGRHRDSSGARWQQ